MRKAQQVASTFAIALSGVVLLPAFLLATYDHQGSSPTAIQLAQLLVAGAALALAVWGHHTRRIALILLSFVFVISWVPLVLAFAD